eukprot:scaffold6592_cov30-Tisochrysis_lutea.AAC.3
MQHTCPASARMQQVRRSEEAMQLLYAIGRPLPPRARRRRLSALAAPERHDGITPVNKLVANATSWGELVRRGKAWLRYDTSRRGGNYWTRKCVSHKAHCQHKRLAKPDYSFVLNSYLQLQIGASAAQAIPRQRQEIVHRARRHARKVQKVRGASRVPHSQYQGSTLIADDGLP